MVYKYFKPYKHKNNIYDAIDLFNQFENPIYKKSIYNHANKSLNITIDGNVDARLIKNIKWAIIALSTMYGLAHAGNNSWIDGRDDSYFEYLSQQTFKKNNAYIRAKSGLSNIISSQRVAEHILAQEAKAQEQRLYQVIFSNISNHATDNNFIENLFGQKSYHLIHKNTGQIMARGYSSDSLVRMATRGDKGLYDTLDAYFTIADQSGTILSSKPAREYQARQEAIRDGGSDSSTSTSSSTSVTATTTKTSTSTTTSTQTTTSSSSSSGSNNNSSVGQGNSPNF